MAAPHDARDLSHIQLRPRTTETVELPSFEEPLRLSEIVAVARRRSQIVVALPFSAAAAVLLVTMMRGVDFVAQCRFMPQASAATAGRLAGLAAQFGVNVGALGGASGESPQFYAELLNSRELLRSVVRARHVTETSSGDTLVGSLVDLYRISAINEAEREDQAIDKLTKRVGVSTDLKTGLITVSSRATTPQLALSINRQIVDRVNQFNLERRQSQAAAERRFVEGRLHDAQQELSQAEANLQSFIEHNRSYQGSPELSLTADRLRRQVDLRQQVYTSLSTSYEQARIEEVRNTPVITIVDQPEVLPRRLTRTMVGRALLGASLGALLAVLLCVGEAYVRRGGATSSRLPEVLSSSAE